MHRQRRRGSKSDRKKTVFRPVFEILEPRVVLSANTEQPLFLYVENGHPIGCGCPACHPDGSPAIIASPQPAATSDTTSIDQLAAAGSPLSSIPVLNSFVGAKATLYLDFTGHTETQWGAYTNIVTPAFDTDGDATTFSSSELSAIQKIWSYVAEDYAPFNINVTTVAPSSFANGVALRVVIGGDGAWTGGVYGGVSYVGSFTSSVPNTAFAFTKNLGNGYPKYVADAVSHEAGHAFGLQHQGQYSGTTKVAEYYTGPGDGRAPLMGNSYVAARSVWWYGQTTSSSTFQDDMSLLAGSTNGFGYRPDDNGNTRATAKALTISGNQVSASGIIHTMTDLDYFSIATGSGSISLTVSVLQGGNDLDARLELRNSSGTLIASLDPSNAFGGTITSDVSAGTYYLVVGSHGSYGDVGQYWVSGSIVAPSGAAAPSNLSATATSASQINLSWNDNASNESGYRVERSTNGSTWTTIATLSANTTSRSDTGLSAGTTYYYRVAALTSSGSSTNSNQASAVTLPSAPSGFKASVASTSQINLSWSDGVGESAYQIERSLNGTSWSMVKTVGAGVTSYQDTGLTASTTYYYRIRASNASGASAYSASVNAKTNAAASTPAAPSNLAITSYSGTQINLSWQDNSSNETNFVIQRSENNGQNWTTVGRVWPNVRTFSDTTVSRNRTYSYRVYSTNANGSSAFTNVVKATTPSAALALFFRGALPWDQGSPSTTVDAYFANHPAVPQGSFQIQCSNGADYSLLVDQVFLRLEKDKRK